MRSRQLRRGGLVSALALFLCSTAVGNAAKAERPFVLSPAKGVARAMAVQKRVVARAGPSTSSRVITLLTPRTPEGTSNLVLALRRVEQGGRIWIEARLPILPNNTVGWIPREYLGGYTVLTTDLVVDLSRRLAVLYDEGRPVWRARIGIGEPQWPTPTGRFYIRNRLEKYSSPMYGPLAFGTSARSAILTDWPAGGFVGIHGTDQPELVPGRISHGCIRLRNADILRLDRLMEPGTPLTIRQ